MDSASAATECYIYEEKADPGQMDVKNWIRVEKLDDEVVSVRRRNDFKDFLCFILIPGSQEMALCWTRGVEVQ